MRKVRGPLLDNLYVRLKQCGNLACAGKPFTEHRHAPDLRPDPSDRRTDWEQATEKLREAIACGALVPGDALPSVPELARLQGLKPGPVRFHRLVRRLREICPMATVGRGEGFPSAWVNL